MTHRIRYYRRGLRTATAEGQGRKKPIIIPRSIMRRKVIRSAGLPTYVLPAHPWLVELIRQKKRLPKREWSNGRLILRWEETEVSWPVTQEPAP